MAGNLSPGGPRSRLGFRASCRMVLNVLRDTEVSLPFTPELPRTPVTDLARGFRNLSTLAGDTPKCCLDLSDLSSGEEMPAFNFTHSPDMAGKILLLAIILVARPKRTSLVTTSTVNQLSSFPLLFFILLFILYCKNAYPGVPIKDQYLILLCAVSINRSRLYRSPSMPEKLDRLVLKRIVRCQDNETPVKVKLRRSPVYEELERGATLKKTASLSDMEIVKVLDQDYGFRQLIGDFSKVYALPTVTGRQQDLRYITPETVAALLFGQFQSLIEIFYIIDCRYPYEYLGGHIKGALNFHRQEDVFEFLLKKPLFPSMPQKRIVLVFHCEFSSERGPKMCRYLREEDRAMNEYPALHYPELYVLKGGYKEFFPEYMELCEPQDYCPMHHQDYKAELLKFRTKSKLWAGDRRRRNQITRLMKL
uniref:M-phase inducer phosphatase n=1 Tax=Chelydra serpentina TaxID=8475 RepID=A0A8C3TJX0_CHESE